MTNHWIFGYGSLIWRPDVCYRERLKARVHGWTRRFWQGSHDHRGTPHSPGRVVTLLPEPNQVCDGMAYLLDPRVVDETFAQLDYREKNGYERVEVDLHLVDGRQVSGLVYIAERDNFAFLGSAPSDQIAVQIFNAWGPSGSNKAYLLSLCDALRDLDIDDPHVFELERLVLDLERRENATANETSYKDESI